MPKETTEAKLRRQIRELIAKGLTAQQIYDRLFLVTFGETTGVQLASLIEEEYPAPAQPLVEVPQQLIDALQNLIDTRVITVGQADKIRNKYIQDETLKRGKKKIYDPDYMEKIGLPQEVQDYIRGFTSSKDLEDRLINITELSREQKEAIFDNIIAGRTETELTWSPDIAIRQVEARRAKEATEIAEKEAKTTSRGLRAAVPSLQRFMNAPGLTPEERAFYTRQIGPPSTQSVAAVNEHLDRLRDERAAQKEAQLGRTLTAEERNALVSPEERQQAMGQLSLRGQSLRDYLNQVNDYATRQARFQMNMVSPFNPVAGRDPRLSSGQTISPFGGSEQFERIRALGKASEQASRAPLVLPESLTEEDVRSAVDEFGFGPGTRLRSFIESQLPPILSDIEKVRAGWWRSVQPRQRERPRESEAEYLWRAKARLEEAIPGLSSNEIIGNTYWGPGGPAAIARQAYDALIGRERDIAEERRRIGAGEIVGDLPSAEPIEEEEERSSRGSLAITRDVMKKMLASALGRRDFRTEFNRLPGVGISSRLAPRVRFS